MTNVSLHVGPKLDEVLSRVGVVLLLRLHLFSHVHLVQLDDRLLELFIVSDVVHRVVNLLFELSLCIVLSFEGFFQASLLAKQSSHPHTQIFDNQLQVVKDSLEMCLLLLHFVGLFFEFVDRVASGPNVTFKFFDFVVKYKFKLF